MDFFNKTKSSFMNAGAALTQKASDMSSTVTITMKIKEIEKNIKDCHAEIARVMLEEYPEELQKLCPDLFKRIQESNKELLKEKRELAICKGLQICPNCGSEESKEVACCTKCGMNIQEASRYMVDMEDSKVCPSCGVPIAGEGAFCSNCGKPLK